MASTSLRFRDVIGRSHMPALDGLRAIAVFTVIFGHAEFPVRGVPADLGVDAFFVLSGFLITRLLLREETETGTVSLSRFYARRTMRIFPAYYAFLLLSFAIDRFMGQHWSPALSISAVTYTVNYFNAFHHHPPTSIAHAWSLGIEEQFYLLWPLAFVALARKSRRAMIAALATAAVAVLAWRTFLMLRGADVAYLYNAFDTRFDNLAVGCLLAVSADYKRVGLLAEALARRAWFPFVTLGVLVSLRTFTSDNIHYSLGFTVYAVLLAVLIAQLMQLSVTPVWSWLEHPVVRYLGTISYPMYLYHGLGDAVGRHSVSGRTPRFVIEVVATIALATGSYYVIERPFLKLKKRFAAAHSPVKAGARARVPSPVAPLS